jgi:hypothetical protein
VKHAERWLVKSKGCAFALTELVTYAGETPDAIGWKGNSTLLVECKASRSDFLSDKKKRFRRDPAQGMGAFRFFMCPHDLIQPHELPEKWGLVWVWKNGNKKQLKGPKGNIFSGPGVEDYYFSERSFYNETLMLVSALRRIHLRGDLEKIYISPFKPDTRFCYNKECNYYHDPYWCCFKNISDLDMCPSRKTRRTDG